MNTQNILHNQGPILDIALDSSQYYDYEIGNSDIDYILYDTYAGYEGLLLTEDEFGLITEDNNTIIY